MATQKEKRRNIIIGVILVGLFLVVASQEGILPFSLSSSVLALSEVDLKSSTPFFSGKAWLLTFTSGTLSQSYFGNFNENDISNANLGDETTTNDFSINVDYSDTTCNYEFQGTSGNTPIYDIQPVFEWTQVPFVSPCTEEEANERGLNNVLFFGKYDFSFTCFAVGYNEQSPVANIDVPDIESEFAISIDVENGQSATRTFNTLSGQTQGYVGDFAFLQWQGNLVSGQQCPDKDPFKGAYVNGVWRVISNTKYESYKNKIDNFPQVGFFQEQAVTDWVSDTMNKAQQAKLSQQFGNIVNPSSLFGGKIRVITQTPIQFPVNSLYVKSSTLGVYTPTPVIRFKSNPNSQCFASGEGNGLISVEIENIGDEAGGYNIGANCPSPFSATNVQGSLQPGHSKTVNIPLSGSGSQRIEKQCEVFLTVLGETTTRNVGVCVDPLVTCTVPYPQKFCAVSNNQDVVKQCSQDGATSNIVEICAANQFCDEGQCKVGGNGNGGSFIEKIKKFFDDLFSGAFDFLTILKYAIIFVFSFISIFVTKDILEGVRGIKKNKPALIVTSIATGAGIGLVLNSFIGSLTFWILVVAGIFYFIFASKIKLFFRKR